MKRNIFSLLPLAAGVLVCFALLIPKATTAQYTWDNIPPTAVCNDQLNISLSGNGEAIVFAETFDEGSNDNKCLAGVKVRRKDDPYATFGPYVVFDCDDIGQLVKVELKAIDCAGNYNICWSYVLVEDKLPPYISCPYPTTVNCDETEDWGVVGMASATDNCGVASIDFQEIDNTGSCGTGTRKRIWTATDHYGNTASCMQTIHVIDDTPVHIDFPPDYTTYDCTTTASLHPDSLPAPFDRPEIIGADCELIATNYEDWVFTAAEPACIKVIREWKVIDWCTYDEYYGDQGLWEDRQILKIIDTLPPTFTCPDDVVVSTNYGECAATFSLPEPTDIEDCLADVEVKIQTELGEGPTYESIPIGEYTAKYILKDGCNNVSTCEIDVSVVDASPPSPVCLNGVSLSLMVNGMAELWASDLEVSSYDFCTPYEDLEFRIGFAPDSAQTEPPLDSVLNFTCENLGTNVVALWVGDNAGNWDYCLTYAIVQDNQEVCGSTSPNAEMAMLAGRVHDEYGYGIFDTEVRMDSSSNWQMTNNDGQYWFYDMPMYDNYTLRPKRSGDLLEGVDQDDVMALAKHLSGVDTLDSPYQIIAADVDGSGYLDQDDLMALQFMVMGLETENMLAHNWRFVPADFEFPIQSPLAVNYPQYITVSGLLSDHDTLNFIGIKLGDLDVDAMENSNAAMAGENIENRGMSSTAYLQLEDRRLQAGQTVEVPVYADPTLGLQSVSLQLRHEGLRLLEVEAYRTAWIAADEPQATQLNLGWAGAQALRTEEPLFYLHFVAEQDGFLSDMLRLQGKSELGLQNGNQTQYAAAELSFQKAAGLHDVQAFPNPFHDQLMLRFELATAQRVQLQVWNTNGQLVHQREMEGMAGFNEWTVDGQQLGEAGTYLFRLSAKDLQYNGRVIRVPAR
ncbi:MAG: HYR domain-containing protein [Bacteroidetes bacterium]|nr:HYR domain-containing protein [Bacteroidota bacterium]